MAYDSENNDLPSEPEDLPDSSSVGLTMSFRSSPPALDQQEPLVDGLCGADLASGAANVDNVDQLAPSSSSSCNSVETTSATSISVATAQLNFTSAGDNSGSQCEQQRTSASVGWLDFVNSTDLGPPLSGGEFQSDCPPQTSSAEMVDVTNSASKNESPTTSHTVKLPSTSASSHSKLRVLLFDME
ncbi:unnamed protein product, partial [Dibothriocephalus latus]